MIKFFIALNIICGLWVFGSGRPPLCDPFELQMSLHREENLLN
jgi:hypothetical protein